MIEINGRAKGAIVYFKRDQWGWKGASTRLAPGNDRGTRNEQTERDSPTTGQNPLSSASTAVQGWDRVEALMLTRRGAVIGAMQAAAFAGMGAGVRPGDALAKAAQPATPVNFDVPDKACDCHTHI